MRTVFLLILLGFFSAYSKDTLRVAINPIEPFIMQTTDGEYEGYDIDLIEKVAKNLKLTVLYTPVDSFQDIFTAIDSGKADVAISAISITSDRMKRYTFSYPYKLSGIGAMVRKESDHSLWRSVGVALGEDFMSVWIAFILFLIIASHIIWLVERGSDIVTKDQRADAFNDKYRYGIFDVLWFSIVTCSTVGYGDKVPKHPLTKVMTGLLILVGVSFAGLAISQMSATIQIDKATYTYNTLNDLNGKNIAYLEGTTSELAIKSHDAIGHPVNNLDSAVYLLKHKKVDAIFFDEPTLRYYANTHTDYFVLNDVCNQQNYGILMKPTNPYANRINIAILKLMEDNTINKLNETWFGK